ncbi:hypothetical protein [uncultured Tateyamaria sp.]|nr:hypothetical protein [uncultured Tateyamaria sp.]
MKEECPVCRLRREQRENNVMLLTALAAVATTIGVVVALINQLS